MVGGPTGRPLTNGVENTVFGRVGKPIAAPLRPDDELPADGR